MIFCKNRGSARLAFLACVAIYHSVDRVAEAAHKKPVHFRQLWKSESVEFALVEMIAHHFKHVLSDDERNRGNRPGLRIGEALGFSEAGDTMDLRNLYFVIRDAVRFVHRKAGTEHPKLPEPTPQEHTQTKPVVRVRVTHPFPSHSRAKQNPMPGPAPSQDTTRFPAKSG
jgi:hypothetical protein